MIGNSLANVIAPRLACMQSEVAIGWPDFKTAVDFLYSVDPGNIPIAFVGITTVNWMGCLYMFSLDCLGSPGLCMAGTLNSIDIATLIRPTGQSISVPA